MCMSGTQNKEVKVISKWKKRIDKAWNDLERGRILASNTSEYSIGLCRMKGPDHFSSH